MKATSARSDSGAGPGLADDPSLADHYVLLGVAFSLVTDSVQVRDFFRAAYSRFRETSPRPGALALSATVHAGPRVNRATAGDASLDLAGRPMPENLAFLFLLNAIMDRVADHVVIHGAAVRANGRGMVLAGPPTAGKSTLVMALARQGMTFLSDDVSPVSRVTGMLHSFPRAVGIRRDATGLALPFDPAAMPPGSVHELPHKWLVDPGAFGFDVASPDEQPCPLAAIVLLDSFEEGLSEPGSPRTMEIALVEPDAATLALLRGIDGISELRVERDHPFHVYSFNLSRNSHVMGRLRDLCRARQDIILYVDEARRALPQRPAVPRIEPMPISSLVLHLTRELLNRSETGSLYRSVGSLPALVSEMGRLLSGVSAYRLRPGEPETTARLLMELPSMAGRA